MQSKYWLLANPPLFPATFAGMLQMKFFPADNGNTFPIIGPNGGPNNFNPCSIIINTYQCTNNCAFQIGPNREFSLTINPNLQLITDIPAFSPSGITPELAAGDELVVFLVNFNMRPINLL